MNDSDRPPQLNISSPSPSNISGNATMKRAASTSKLTNRTSWTPKLLYPQPSYDTTPRPRSTSPRHLPTTKTAGNSSRSSMTSEASRRLSTEAALREAMEESVIGLDTPSGSGSNNLQRPANAQMASSSLNQPLKMPPLFDLARQTTLSSAAVMQLPPPPSDPASDNLDYTPIRSQYPTLMRQGSPPSRTSIDALRSIQRANSLHTSATSNVKGSQSSGWWFQNKADVEPLLEDRDKDDGTETAEEKLRKRCELGIVRFCEND